MHSDYHIIKKEISIWTCDRIITHREMQTVLQRLLAQPCLHKEIIQHYNPTKVNKTFFNYIYIKIVTKLILYQITNKLLTFFSWIRMRWNPPFYQGRYPVWPISQIYRCSVVDILKVVKNYDYASYQVYVIKCW